MRGARRRWRPSAAGTAPPPYPAISDDEIRATIEANQLRLLRERGADMTIFSPRASAMAPHVGDETVSLAWARACNDLIARVCESVPGQLRWRLHAAAVARREPCCEHRRARALRRPRASSAATSTPIRAAGHFDAPPLTDRFWYPFYETMVGARRAGDDPRLGIVQPGAARDGRLLHRGRHDRLHAADRRRPVCRLPAPALHHSPRRRRSALSLGTVSRAGRHAARSPTSRHM